MVDSLVMGCQAKNVICLDAQGGALMRSGGPADVPKVQSGQTGEYGARPENQPSPENENVATVEDRIGSHHSHLHHHYHCRMNITERDEGGLLALRPDCYNNSRVGVYLQSW